MMTFKKNITDRKRLSGRIGELTGEHPVYTRAPLYAYQIGCYMVDREGNLQVEAEQADPEILTKLLNEGLILMPDEDEETSPEGLKESGNEPKTEEPVKTEQEAEGKAETDMLDLPGGFSFPLSEHTGLSLRNLVNLIYSRADLINKAVGSHFHVEKQLVEFLEDDICTYSVTNFRNTLEKYEAEHGTGLIGLELGEESVNFTGFDEDAPDEIKDVCSHLAFSMNQMALAQRRVQAKGTPVENEKYAFRIWLIRLGMTGDNFKKDRKILLRNLSGHTAFRTPEEAEQAKVRNKKKREAMKKIQTERLQAEADSVA